MGRLRKKKTICCRGYCGHRDFKKQLIYIVHLAMGYDYVVDLDE